MSDDILQLQPDTLNTADSTYEIEGYEAHVEEIQKEFPEEDFRAPLDRQIEQQEEAEQLQQASDTAFEEGSVAQEQPLNIADYSVEGAPAQAQVQDTQPVQQFVPDENNWLSDEQLWAVYGKNLPEGLKRKLALNWAYLDDKEEVLNYIVE